MKHSLRAVALRPLQSLPPLPFSVAVHLMYQHEFSTFKNPKTFTELVIAKKLFDRNPKYELTVDKLRVRDYVAERLGGNEHLVPLLQAVDTVEEIDFDNLKEPCVMKARHGFNMTHIARRGDPLDRKLAKRKAAKWMKINNYHRWKEWAYRDCPRGVIVEEFLGDGSEPPPDYKVYVFNGRAELIQVDSDRFIGHKLNLFNRDWNEMEFKGAFPPLSPAPRKPRNLEKMLEIAETIGAEFPFARIDLYNLDGRIYFGEITHYPGAGIITHKPREFDIALGRLWLEGTPIPAHFVKTNTG